AVGHWELSLAAADEFIAEVEAGAPHYLAPVCYQTRSMIRLSRDDVPGALADAERALGLARIAKDSQVLFTTMSEVAHVQRETGNLEQATRLAEELLAELRTGRNVGWALVALHKVAWTLCALGRGDDLVEALPLSDL